MCHLLSYILSFCRVSDIAWFIIFVIFKFVVVVMIYGQKEFECQHWLEKRNLTYNSVSFWPSAKSQCAMELISHPPSHVMLAPFLSLSFDVSLFVRKCLFPWLHLSGEYEKCFREPKHLIFSLFVVTVTVTHPAVCGTAMLFLLSPWIK